MVSTSRAFSTAFASTSGRSGGEAASHSLAALPARVRAFINGERLNTALTQLAAIDASAKVRSAVHEARGIYQRRIATIQRELLRDRADLSHAQVSAPRFVALCNGLLCSNGGRVRPLTPTASPVLSVGFDTTAFIHSDRKCCPHVTSADHSRKPAVVSLPNWVSPHPGGQSSVEGLTPPLLILNDAPSELYTSGDEGWEHRSDSSVTCR